MDQIGYAVYTTSTVFSSQEKKKTKKEKGDYSEESKCSERTRRETSAEGMGLR